MSDILVCGIIDLDSMSINEWINFTSKINGTPSFSKIAMLKAVEALGWSVCIYIGRVDGRISIALPFAVKKYGLIKIARGFPLGLYTGLLALPMTNDIDKETFLDQLFGEFESYSSVSLFFDPFDFFMQSYMLNRVKNKNSWREHIASIVNLSPSIKEIQSNYKHGVRKNIRQANEKCVKISEVKSIEELLEFYEVASYIYLHYSGNMPYSFEFYKSIFIGNAGRFLLARVDGCIVGGSIHICGNSQSFNLLTVAYKIYNNFHANTLLINQEIEDAKIGGASFYNLGASPLGEGALLSFKNSWGAEHKYYRSFEKHSIYFLVINEIRYIIQVAINRILK
jgi:hypothetical protein